MYVVVYNNPETDRISLLSFQGIENLTKEQVFERSARLVPQNVSKYFVFDASLIPSEYAEDRVSINENGVFFIHDKVIPVPDSITRYQARTMLKLTKLEGHDKTLFQLTDEYMEAIPKYTEDKKLILIKGAWEDAAVFERNSEVIKICQEMFELSDEIVDDLFIKANSVV